MRILAFSTLRAFWSRPGHADAEEPLRRWYRGARRARWENPADVRAFANTADFVADRVVFDIGGNKYRLIVRVQYAPHYLVRICFVGTHAEYDRVNAATVLIGGKKL